MESQSLLAIIVFLVFKTKKGNGYKKMQHLGLAGYLQHFQGLTHSTQKVFEKFTVKQQLNPDPLNCVYDGKVKRGGNIVKGTLFVDLLYWLHLGCYSHGYGCSPI